MGTPRPPLTLLPGGRPPHAPDRPLERGRLRLVEGSAAELEEALFEAVEAARQMRLEIERRIARALAAFEDRR